MRGRWALMVALLCCASSCFLFAFAHLMDTTGWRACLDIKRAKMIKFFVQSPWQELKIGDAAAAREMERRRLAEPGSYPPRCTSKCGKCAPCRPVHVPVPPGQAPRAIEYYPEMWRCKCGSHIFLP